MKRIAILLLILCQAKAYAQKLPDMGLYKVRITAADKTITAEIKPPGSEPAMDFNKFYSWYSSNQIRQTQGGYSGTLLNGQYKEFYLNKGLKVQGNFDKGLKDGVWKQWTEDGILSQAITWKNGIKQGGFTYYDAEGNLRQKGFYRNSLLDGKQVAYDTTGKEQVATYRDGNLLPPNGSVSFWSRINIFKKKH